MKRYATTLIALLLVVTFIRGPYPRPTIPPKVRTRVPIVMAWPWW